MTTPDTLAPDAAKAATVEADYFQRDGSPVPPTAKILRDEKGRPFIAIRSTCCRCGGDGRWKGHFIGVCFRCGGKGYAAVDCRDVKLYTRAENAKLDASLTKRQAAKAAKKAVERDVNAEAFTTAHAALLAAIPAEWLEEGVSTFRSQFHSYHSDTLVATDGGYLNDTRPQLPNSITVVRDIVYKGRKFGSISPKQAELLASLTERGKADLVALQAREAARAVQVASSQFVGTEGGKLAPTAVTVTKLGKFQRESFDGRREETVIVATFADAQGNVLVTKTPTFGHDLVVGQTGVLSGTVKLHSTYRDVKQTQVIRPKLTVG